MSFVEESAQFLNDSAANLAEDGMHNEAIACLKKGLLLEPTNGTLWFNLGLSYRALNKTIDSVSALAEAAKLNPSDADVWDTLGIVLFEIGNYNESAIAYKRALKIETGSGRIWNNYGTLLFNQQKYQDARQAFESAIALDPTLYDALFNLKDTYEELGNTEKADICSNLMAQMENYD